MHTNFEEIVSEVNTNLLGAINIAKASHKYLKESKGSLVLFTSSYIQEVELVIVYIVLQKQLL